jgi:hypothetical protein
VRGELVFAFVILSSVLSHRPPLYNPETNPSTEKLKKKS